MDLATKLIASLGVPVVAVMAAGIVLSCIATICRMTWQTNHFIRAFYIIIATGAFGELVVMMTGTLPTVHEFLFFLGVGLLFVFDRRNTRNDCCRRTVCEKDREAAS